MTDALIVQCDEPPILKLSRGANCPIMVNTARKSPFDYKRERILVSLYEPRYAKSEWPYAALVERRVVTQAYEARALVDEYLTYATLLWSSAPRFGQTPASWPMFHVIVRDYLWHDALMTPTLKQFT